MANPTKSFLTGTDAVMNWYDVNAKKPYWSVADSKGDILFYYAGNEENEARDHLENNLRMAESSGVEATLTLRIHPKLPKAGYFDNKSEKIVVTHFRPVSFNPTSFAPVMAGMQYGNNQLLDELRAMRSELAAIKMKQDIEELEEDEEEEPEEENMLSGFMKNPQIQNLLISQLAGLFAPAQKVTHVAGIAENDVEMDEKIMDAVERLKKCDDQLGDDLLLLCEMAENDPMQFKFLLKMLRGK